jgi:flagellar basal body-associated protein FliL
MKIDLKNIDKRDIIKKAIIVVSSLIGLLLMTVGVLTSDFNKIKKFDKKDKSARQLISSKLQYNQLHKTDIEIDSNNNTANLGDFTFNVGEKNILIANISLKFKSNKNNKQWIGDGDDIEQEIVKKSTILKDAVIDTMIGNQYTSADSQGMKREIKRNINTKLSSGEIEEVYFNKFIFQ